MKKRYTVIDHKRNVKNKYYEWQWNLAFAIVFIAGLITGVVIYFSLT
jgi:uncharacterized integral membrane protein